MIQAMHATALTDGVPTLYHYQSLNFDHLTNTLRNQIVKGSDPARLNDPWDCKPCFNPDALDDSQVLEKEMAWRDELYGRALTIAKLGSDPAFRRQFMHEASVSMEAMIASRRIYCLTPHPDSTLMWSHYADDHCGICLQFSVGNMLFSRAARVVYLPEYPKLMPWEINANRGRVMDLILTKSKDWDYENEYRIVSVDKPQDSFQFLDDGFFRLPKGALQAVIIGCNVKDADQVIGAIRAEDPKLTIKRAVRHANLYKLQIVDTAHG
jgi:hypothetical protein